MTRRAWVILVVGLLLSASLGGVVLSDRGQASTPKPPASWNAFTSAAWDTVKERVAGRGFDGGSVWVVAATGDQRGHTLALIAATRPSGATCFIPARGMKLEASICRLTKPVLVFAARGRFREIAPSGNPRKVPATEVVGLVRPNVTSVVVSWTALGHLNVQGQPLMDVPGGFAFGGGFRGLSAKLLARDSHGTVVTRLDLAPR